METTAAEDEPYLSLVVPVYNGASFIERSLRTVLDFTAAQPYRSEVIVIDDGSTDATREILRRYEGQVRVLVSERNRGKGHAVRRGVLASHGQFVVYTDADIPFTLEPLPRFLKYLDQKELDLVIGARNLEQTLSVVRPSWIRRLSSAVFTAFVSRIVVTGITDTQCGLKGFRRAAAQLLFSRSRIDRFAFDVEIIYIAFKKNLDLKRVPVTLADTSSSTVRLFPDALRMLRDTFLIKWNHMRGRYD